LSDCYLLFLFFAAPQHKLRSHLGIKKILQAVANSAVVEFPHGNLHRDAQVLTDAHAVVERAWAETSSFEMMVAGLLKVCAELWYFMFRFFLCRMGC
jgi:hypothetical protein